MVEIDNRAILVILFTLVIGMMAIYAGSDDSANLETNSELDINETESSEDKNVQENNLTGATREIYGSGEEREQETEETEEEKEGIILDTEPVAGKSNRITLYEGGERASQETIYINGEELGQTNNAGALRFTTPNAEEITVTTQNQIDEQTYAVEKYKSDELVLAISNTVMGKTITVNVKDSDNNPLEEADVFVDGQKTGETNLVGEAMIKVPFESNFELLVNHEDYESNKESYETEWPEIKFDILSPADSETINDHVVRLEFQIESEFQYDFEDSPIMFQYDIRKNDEIIINEEIPAGNHNISHEMRGFSPSAENNIRLELEVNESKDLGSKSAVFETTEEPPIAYFELFSPDGETDTNPIFDYEIQATEDLSYDVLLDDESIQQGSVPGGETYRNGFDHGVDEGDHEWRIRIEKADGEELISEVISFSAKKF